MGRFRDFTDDELYEFKKISSDKVREEIEQEFKVRQDLEARSMKLIGLSPEEITFLEEVLDESSTRFSLLNEQLRSYIYAYKVRRDQRLEVERFTLLLTRGQLQALQIGCVAALEQAGNTAYTDELHQLIEKAATILVD